MKRLFLACMVVLLMVGTVFAGDLYIIPLDQVKNEHLIIKRYTNLKLALVSSAVTPVNGLPAYGQLIREKTTPDEYYQRIRRNREYTMDQIITKKYRAYIKWTLPTAKKFNAFFEKKNPPYLPVVALLDTGCNHHPEIEGNVLWEHAINAANTSLGNNVADVVGHGTSIAGMISGITTGITPQVRIVPIKITTDEAWATWESIAQAFDLAIETNKKIAQPHRMVINFSFGIDAVFYIDGVRQFWDEVFASLRENNILLVNAAGNSNSNADYYFIAPSCYYNPSMLSVGAVTVSGKLAIFSNYGQQVDTLAPGVLIYTTTWYDGYAFVQGTSFSSPYVAAVAAAYWCLVPDKQYYFIRADMIRHTYNLPFKLPVFSKGIICPDKLITEVERYQRSKEM